MLNFTFHCPTKILFGREAESHVGEETRRCGTRVLFHYGSGSIKKTGLYERVLSSLQAAGLEVTELGGVQPNSRLSLAREGVELCREKGIDVILGVGGGSVIDSAKAIAIGVPYEGDLWDLLTWKTKVTDSLPVGSVVTFPAAGSEMGPATVLTDDVSRQKKWVAEPLMTPKFAILNPELSFTLPPHQTAAGGVDIMSHVLERYLTKTKGADFTDNLCEATLKTVIKHLPIVLREPTNYDSRSAIMWAGAIAHNGLLGTGRDEDWGSHDIDTELGALYDITHGAGLAVMFPAWMKHIYRFDVERFGQYASRVWGVEPDFENLERTALEGIRRTEAFFASVGMPTRLRELNLPKFDFDMIAQRCEDAGFRGSIKRLTKNDVVSILKLANTEVSEGNRR